MVGFGGGYRMRAIVRASDQINKRRDKKRRPPGDERPCGPRLKSRRRFGWRRRDNNIDIVLLVIVAAGMMLTAWLLTY